jgi:hypothetical protein
LSRSQALAALLAILCPAFAAPAAAQDATDRRVQQMIDRAKDAYTPPAKPAANPCGESTSGEIVVCGRENGDRYRIQNDSDSTDTGIPHADVGSHPPAGGVSARGCFLQKCPREVYLIDLSKIPEAPPDSDADKIARGEMRAP